ncbi:FAD-binding protein [bacterium]|nr:FAD-binding protein [bacterium]
MADRPGLVRRLRASLGRRQVLDDTAARVVYARDASHLSLGRPLCVCLPRDAEEVAAAVSACTEAGVPYVARGAGSGLAGGVLPPEGAVVISLARLVHIREAPSGREDEILAGAGATNAALNRRLAPRGRCFAPDPGSMEVSTIGGNVACNAGGPHCLKIGTTVRHVRELQWVDGEGRIWSSGRVGDGAPDLTALLVGSEGTLGVVSAAALGTRPVDSARATRLAYFESRDAAAAGIVALLGGGLLPAALELVDGDMLRIVEQAFAFGFRTDAAAAMIVEFGGETGAVDADAVRAAARLAGLGADVVRANDEGERQDLWRCRKRAFGAVGRLSPSYVSMDVAVPLGRLPEMTRRAREAGRRHDVRVATLMHAGDGNMHPGIMYDTRVPGEAERARAAADDIIGAALALGGTVTGEHGVGIEKLDTVAAQFDPAALTLMHGIKDLFDPRGLCNPDKALPAGAGRAVPPPAPGATRFDWDDLVVVAPAGTRAAALRAEAGERGFRIAGVAPGNDASLGVLAAAGALRDGILEVWATTRAGRDFHAGRPVAKNVAGYDLVRLVCGEGGALADLRGLTLQLRPAGESPPLPSPTGVPPAWTAPEPYRRGLVTLFAGGRQP